MFFGMVTPAFNTKNPYVQEDYMNVLVNLDWSSRSNIWYDIIASTDLRNPIVSSGALYKKLYFILLEVEEDDTIVDSAMVEFTFVNDGGVSYLDNAKFLSPTNNSAVKFETTPQVGQTVKALLISLHSGYPAP